MLVRKTVRIPVHYKTTKSKLVKDNNIAKKAGLSAGYVDQCIDKVLWT